MTTEAQALAARLSRLERMLSGLAAGRLRNTSLEDGSVEEYDRNGVLGSIWGRQWDDGHGVVSLNGPTPPTPGGIEVSTLPGALRVTWLGEWDPTTVDGQPVVAPSDFARVEIHVSTSADLSGLLRETLKTTISTPRGADARVDLDYDQAYYVRLITRATTGKVSAPSPLFGPYTVPKLAQADIDIDFSAIGGNTIFFGSATPTTTKVGDIWNKWVNSPAVPAQYEAYRWDGDSWERLRDSESAAAILAAEAAQAAADQKARLFAQDEPPTGLGLTDKAIWIDTNADNTSYSWSGSAWTARLIGNAAIQPASLVASDVIATGTVSAALLEALFIISNTIIAGTSATVAHTRIDSDGVTAIAFDPDNLPVEVGRFGEGWGVRNVATGDIVGSMTNDGSLAAKSIITTDPDPSFGGVLLSQHLWETAWGNVAYGQYPAVGGNATSTNTEAAFMELGFKARRGRQYVIYVEGVQPLNSNTDPGGFYLRCRHTTADDPVDPAVPNTASSLVRAWNWDDTVDNAWNTSVPNFALYNGPALDAAADKNVRLVFTYGVGNGTAASVGATISRDRTVYIWVMDVGPLIPETGDVLTTGGTSGGTTTKTNYTYEATASWVRTWNQSGDVIYDDEMHQGYGDSFNGIRRASAGWSSIPSMTGATVTEVQIYMESYHWWNESGGICYMGGHGSASEPASWPGNSPTMAVVEPVFIARSQARWINVTNNTGWVSQVAGNGFKGISISAPSTSATYYAKFRGPAYARPKLRIKYTK